MTTVLNRERKTDGAGRRGGTDIYFRSVLPVLLAIALSACIVVPTPEHGLQSGRGAIAETDIMELEVGKTTREQVLLRFGEPLRHFRDGRVFIYHWTVKTGYMAAASYVGVGGGALERNYQVTLEFDEQGLLTRHERLKYEDFFSSDSIAQGENFSLEDLKTPVGGTRVFVYRHAGRTSVIPLQIDDYHLADLQPGGFAIVDVSPGEHAVRYHSHRKRWRWETLPLITRPDERVFIRMNLKVGWRDAKVELEMVPEGQAINEIMKTRRSAIVRPSYLFTD